MKDELKSKFTRSTGLEVGKHIYSGNGEIFSVKRNPTKLVKFLDGYSKTEAQDMFKVIRYLKDSKNKSVVRLYNIGILSTTDTMYNEKTYCVYYVMNKLFAPIGINIFNYIMSAYYSGKPLINQKANNFIVDSNKLKYEYHDFHSGNIMSDKSGNYKFIDLESFYIKYDEGAY